MAPFAIGPPRADSRGSGGRPPGKSSILRFVAFRGRWALVALLAAVLPAAACTSTPGASATGTGRPAITATQARQVWDHYVAVDGAQAGKAGDPGLALALETGARRAYHAAADTVLEAQDMSASVIVTPAYRTPTFYLPEQAGYPHFFVVSVAQKPTSVPTITEDGVTIPLSGPELVLFEQASAGAPWLLAGWSNLAAGQSIPKLATDGAGYVPTVSLSDPSLVAQPDDAGPLQAAVVDDGGASAAGQAVASGPLTTGLYQGAVSRADELTPPQGDVYQWELTGTSYPEFALRTAAGGALVFYAMSFSITVAVPDYLSKADPVHSGPPIQVPEDLRPLLPKGQPAPLVQLSANQTLSFAAVDPAAGDAKIQVIAMGGGLTSASAS